MSAAFHRSWPLVAAACAVLAGLGTASASAAPPAPTHAAQVAALPGTPDTSLNAQWNSFGDSATCSGWSGGDGTQSIKLPSGRRAWFFADTYMDAPSTRPGFGLTITRNSIVVQNGSSLRTMTGGDTCRIGEGVQPKSIVQGGAGDDAAYWPGDGKIVGSNIVKFYLRVTATAFPNAAMVTIPVSSLDNDSTTVLNRAPTLLPARDLGGGNTIIWGAALSDSGDYTYVYGWGEIPGQGKKPFLARVNKANLASFSAWRFYVGRGRFSSAGGASGQAQAQPLSVNVEPGFSVAVINAKRWLIQHDPNDGAGGLHNGNIVALEMTQHWAFSGRQVTLYDPPEQPHAAPEYMFVYEARLHSGLAPSGAVMISYNVNTSAVNIGCRSRNDYDAGIYRPRFVSVPVTGFANPTAVVKKKTAWTLKAEPMRRGIRMPKVPKKLPTSALAKRTTASKAARSAADMSWYESWAYPSGCPPVPSAANLAAAVRADGSVDLDWDDIGPDVWFTTFQRNATDGTEFRALDWWSVDSQRWVVPLWESGDNYGKNFEWQVEPYNIWGHKGGRSNTAGAAIVMRPPPAPTGVTATGEGQGAVKVTWQETARAGHYWVYQGSGRHGPYWPTLRDTVISGLASGEEMCFQVSAENLGGEGEKSSAACVTVP